MGLSKQCVHASLKALTPVLVCTYHTGFNTQIAHWNVQGPHFFMLHTLFEEQYKELNEAVDELAERIRQLGDKPDPRLSKWAEASQMDWDGHMQDEMDYIDGLIKNHQLVIDLIRNGLVSLEESADEGTKDLLIKNLQIHEKSVWFLESHKRP